MLIVTTCIDMSLKTLYKIIKVRWEIENSIFNNFKNEAAMGHCFVHGGNAIEAVLYCIFKSCQNTKRVNQVITQRIVFAKKKYK